MHPRQVADGSGTSGRGRWSPPALVLGWAVLLFSCGSASPPLQGVVTNPPEGASPTSTSATYASPVGPTPTVPTTGTSTSSPSRRPLASGDLAPPEGSRIQSSAGSQRGAAESYCWQRKPSGAKECVDTPVPIQEEALVVQQQEILAVEIDAARDPDSLKAIFTQGDVNAVFPLRADRKSEIRVEVARGTWDVRLCGSWNRHGEVCWIFLFRVQ